MSVKLIVEEVFKTKREEERIEKLVKLLLQIKKQEEEAEAYF